MATRTDVLQIQLKTDGEGRVTATLAGVEQRLEGIGRAGDRASDGLGAVAGQLRTLAGVATAGLGLAELASQFVQVNREAGVLRASLATATGGVDAARAKMQELTEFAAQVPESLSDVVTAFTRLQNLRLDSSTKALESYSNTAAAMGKSLMDMVEAVADASTGEFERLKEFGIVASSEGEKIKFTFRGVTTEVEKNAAAIEQYLLAIGNTEFAGAAAERMKTLDGAISNLGDSWQRFLTSLGDAGATQALIGGIGLASEALSGLAALLDSGLIPDAAAAQWDLWWQQISAGAAGAAEMIRATFASLDDGSLSAALGPLADGQFWADIGESIRSVFAALGDGQFWQDVLQNGLDLLQRLGQAALDFPINWQAAVAIMVGEADQLWATLETGWENAKLYAQLALNGVATFASGAMAQLKVYFAQAWDYLLDRATATLSAMTNAIAGWAPDAVTQSLVQATAALSNAPRAAQAAAEGLARAKEEGQQAAAAIRGQIEANNQALEARKAASQEAIAAALKDREAALAARDAALQDAQSRRQQAAAAKGAAGAVQSHSAAAQSNASANKEAAAAAKQLAQAYDNQVASLKQQIALLGKDDMASRIRYDIEEGRLKALQQAQKDTLLSLAKEYDAKKRLNDLMEEGARLHEQLLTPQEKYAEQIAHLNELLAQGAISQEDYSRAVAKADQELARAGASADQYAEIWKRAVDSIDQGFADMWQSLFTGGIDSFKDWAKQLKNAVINLLAELAHAALTRPILVQLGILGPQGGLGSLFSGGSLGGGGGLGNLFGSPGGWFDNLFGTTDGWGTGLISQAADWLGLSGAAASWGITGTAAGLAATGLAGGGSLAALGAADTAGTAAGMGAGAWGLVGAAEAAGATGLAAGGSAAAIGSGGFLSGLAAVAPYALLAAPLLFGLFGHKKPPNRAAGGVVDLNTGGVRDLWGESGKNPASPETLAQREAFLGGVSTLAQALAALSGEQIQGWLAVDIGERDGVQVEIDGIKSKFASVEEAMAHVTDVLLERAQGLSDTYKTLLDNADPAKLTDYAKALTSIDYYSSGKALADYRAELERTNLTQWDLLQEQRQRLAELAAGFDGSAEAALELAGGLEQFGAMAKQVAADIRAAMQNLNEGVGNFVEQIRYDGMDPAAKYEYDRGMAEYWGQKALEEDDPYKRQEAADRALDYAQRAYNDLTPEQKAQLGPQFIAEILDWQSQVDAKNQADLDALGNEFSPEVEGSIAAAIQDALAAAAEQFAAAAEAQKQAAQQQQQAANTQLAAAKTPIRVQVDVSSRDHGRSEVGY